MPNLDPVRFALLAVINASALSLWEKAGGEGCRGKSLERALVKETPRVKEAQ
jgi:hypothetical protein